MIVLAQLIDAAGQLATIAVLALICTSFGLAGGWMLLVQWHAHRNTVRRLKALQVAARRQPGHAIAVAHIEQQLRNGVIPPDEAHRLLGWLPRDE